MMEPTVSRKTYLLTWVALLALTLATTLIGFVDLGPFSMIIAVALAAAKASLIVLFFMHALYEFKLVRVIIAGGIIWFLIFVGLTLNDYLSRGWLSSSKHSQVTVTSARGKKPTSPRSILTRGETL